MSRYFVPGTRAHNLVLLFLGCGVTAFLLLAFASCTSCTADQRATVSKAGHAVVDCAKVEAGPVAREVGVLAAHAIEAGHVDWPALEDLAFSAGKEIGGCAYVAFTRAMSSTSSAPSILPDPAAVSMARLSHRFGDVEWQ